MVPVRPTGIIIVRLKYPVAKQYVSEDRAMHPAGTLAVSVCSIGLLIGCSRSNDAEVSKARAEADSARTELAKARAEAEIARAELLKVRADLDAARRDAGGSKQASKTEP